MEGNKGLCFSAHMAMPWCLLRRLEFVEFNNFPEEANTNKIHKSCRVYM